MTSPATLLPIYWHSITQLTPSMIFWRIHRTAKGAVIRACERAMPSLLPGRPASAVDVRPLPPVGGAYHCEDIDLAARRFSFLNAAVTLPGERESRRAAVAAQPLLWRFHYGYHDYVCALLRDGRCSLDQALDFLAEWDADHPLRARGARASDWHPYVLSLRIEAWIRVHEHARRAGRDPRDPALALLARGVELMTRVLLRNLERGTMANHFLKNIKALALAGAFLAHPTGARARRAAARLLPAQLREQVLDDGLHYERSPMYHAQLTSDVLDLVDVLAAADRRDAGAADLPAEPSSTDPLADAVLLRDTARRMTEALARTMHPDGDVAWFNDATASFFLRPAEVLARGERLTGAVSGAQLVTPEGAIDPSRHSGLLAHRAGALVLFFDAGNVGPDYQPGHAHCDTLSFEASWRGMRVLTDTGVFHYRESRERRIARSTAAHSTLRIDGVEQSEVWKSFRVGRRARIIRAAVERHGGLSVLRGAHDGYGRLRAGLVHERAVAVYGDAWMCVLDAVRLDGRGGGGRPHRVERFLHLAPGCRVQLRGGGAVVETSEGTLHIRDIAGTPCEVLTTDYYPAFGVRQHRSTLVWRVDATPPWLGACTIVFGDAPPPAVVLDAHAVTVEGHSLLAAGAAAAD